MIKKYLKKDIYIYIVIYMYKSQKLQKWKSEKSN